MSLKMLPGVGGQGLGNPTTLILRPLSLIASGCAPKLAHLFAIGFRLKHIVLGNKDSSYLSSTEQTISHCPHSILYMPRTLVSLAFQYIG